MLYSQKEIIKNYRKLAGLTQSQLAEGICSRIHIVNAETGVRKLSDFVFRDVLLKLGLNPNDFNIGIDIEDNDTVFFLQKYEEISTSVANWNRDNLIKIKDEINDYLIEKTTEPANAKAREFLMLVIETHINMPQSDNINNPDLPKPDILKAREYATKAIKLYRPTFDLNKIDSYFLTMREYQLINTLATTYGYLNDLPKEIEILNTLKINFEKNQKNIIEIKGLNPNINAFYSGLLTNIAINYKLLGMWEECLTQSIKNMEIFLKCNDIRLYARAIYQRSYSLMKLDKKEEGRHYYNKFFMLAYVLDGFSGINFAVVKKEYEEVFGETMEIRVDW